MKVRLPLLSSLDQGTSLGLVLAIAGTTLFSFKPILIKLIYAEGVDTITMLTWRMGMALPFYLAVGIWRLRRDTSDIELTHPLLLRAAGLGVVGYYAASFLDMYGLQFISTQLGRMILFTYPTLVTLLGWWLLGQRVQSATFRALGLSYIGIALIFSWDLRHYGADVVQGAGWIFLSAICFSLFLLFSKPLISRMGSTLFTCVAMSTAAVAVLGHFALSGFGAIPSMEALGLIGILAIVSTVMPSFLVAAAIHRIGASSTSIAGCFGPVVTAGLAVLLLGEAFTLWHLAGMALVVAAITMIPATRPEQGGK